MTDGDINARGAEISGKNVALTAARDINLESAQDAASQNSKSSGSNASIGVGLSLGGTQNGFTIELAAAQNKAKADGTAVTNQNTHVTAGDTLTIASGRDTNLKGATATGDTIKADIGRDLNIESRQDTDDYHSRESSSGMQASICVPPICYGTTVSASGSVSSGKTDSTYASVVEQTGLYAGKGGFDINVEGNTGLKGAVIASTAEKDKNTLTTGTLTTSDIENKAEYKSDTSTIAGSFSGGQGGTSVLQNLADSLAATAAGNAQKPTEGGAGGTTRSAIADGTIKIKDATGQQEKTGQTAEETIAALNRDTAAANESVSKIFDEQKVKDEQAFKRLMSETVQQAAPMLYNQVGSALENSTPETKALVHALVGGLISQALGGSFAAGAAAGGAASLAMETFGEALLDVDGLSDADRKALVQLAGAFVGGVAGAVAGGSPNDAAAGANVGKVATENNYLNHKQKRERAEALADCKDDQCEKEVRDEYARKWTENREDVANCSSYAECTSLAQELRAEQNAQGQRIAELQGKGPTNWTEAERLEYADLRLGDTTVNQMRSLALASAARYGVDSSLGSPEIADLIADVGIGVASGFGGSTFSSRKLTFEPAPYHGTVDNPVKSRGPVNGQESLDTSVQIKDTSPRRVSVDRETGDFVVFDRTNGDVYHGHVRKWEDLTIEMQNSLIKAGYADRRGNVK